MVTLWKSGELSWRTGSGEQGEDAAQSAPPGICSDKDWERFSMKLFFLRTPEQRCHAVPAVATVAAASPPLGTFLGMLLRQLLLQRPLPVLTQPDGTVLLDRVERHGVLGVLLLQS